MLYGIISIGNSYLVYNGCICTRRVAFVGGRGCLLYTSRQAVLGIPSEYLPLDSFEGEGGFFYNRNTGEVLEIELDVYKRQV